MPDDGEQREADRAARRRHDAVNLLMVIDLACESLLQQVGLDDPMREDLDQIVEARRQLMALADEGSF
jgi:hypothetical protein